MSEEAATHEPTVEVAHDGAVAGRDLLGHEPQPGGEVAAFGEAIAGADRGHCCASDDWPDPGHAHQPLTTDILACHRFNLARQALDPFIEAPPVGGEPFDDARHA